MPRPQGKKACNDCTKRKVKCMHASFSLKRKSDEITAMESRKVLSSENSRLHWIKRRRFKNKSRNTDNFNRNPDGLNQHTKRKRRIEAPGVSTTPETC
jgi:hypothetical protein